MKKKFLVLPTYSLLLMILVLISTPASSQVLRYDVRQLGILKRNTKDSTIMQDATGRLTIDEVKKLLIIQTPHYAIIYSITKIFFDNSSVYMVCKDSKNGSCLSILKRIGGIHPMWLKMQWSDVEYDYMMDIFSEDMN